MPSGRPHDGASRASLLLILLVVLTLIAALAPLMGHTIYAVLARGAVAVAAMAVGFAFVWRSRAGPRAVLGAVLILVNIVLALRAFTTPR